MTWPPLDEFKEILKTSMFRLIDDQGQVKKIYLPAPFIK